MCPRHHGRAAPLLGPGSIAERGVAAADADRVHLAGGAEGLVASRGDQTRGRGGAGLAVHDSCDTEQGLSVWGEHFTAGLVLQSSCKPSLHPQSTAGAQGRHLSGDRTNSPRLPERRRRSARDFSVVRFWLEPKILQT